MDFGNINTDWVLIVTVIVCTWFLGAKIHHLMQDMVTLGLQNEKDSTQNMGELVQVLESGLLEVTTTLEKIDTHMEVSRDKLENLDKYVYEFYLEKKVKDEKEKRENDLERKKFEEYDKDYQERLKKEGLSYNRKTGKLESIDNDEE